MNELIEERQSNFKKRQKQLRDKWLPEKLKNKENSLK